MSMSWCCGGAAAGSGVAAGGVCTTFSAANAAGCGTGSGDT